MARQLEGLLKGCNSECTAFLAYFLKNVAILDVKAAFLVAFYYVQYLKVTIHSAFEAMRNFYVRYTPGWRNLCFQDLVINFQHLLHKSRVQKSNVRLGSIDFFSFRWVRFRSIAKVNWTQSMNWVRFHSILKVRLKFSSIGFDLLCRV